MDIGYSKSGQNSAFVGLIICFVLYISTFRSICAVHSVAVLCGYLMSCFGGMLLRYIMLQLFCSYNIRYM
jgi:hypothetical protein